MLSSNLGKFSYCAISRYVVQVVPHCNIRNASIRRMLSLPSHPLVCPNPVCIASIALSGHAVIPPSLVVAFPLHRAEQRAAGSISDGLIVYDYSMSVPTTHRLTVHRQSSVLVGPSKMNLLTPLGQSFCRDAGGRMKSFSAV